MGVVPGMANGPCVEQPITVWRKSTRSSDLGVSWVKA